MNKQLYPQITLADIQKAIALIYTDKDKEIKPDVIVTHKGKYFYAKVKGNGDRAVSVHTGIGGLKQIFKSTDFPELFIIEYNGVILSYKQKVKFINALTKYK